DQGGVRSLRIAYLGFFSGRPVIGPPGRGAAANPLGGSYTLSGDGQVHAWDGAPYFGSPRFGWDIARGISVMPDGQGSVVLDGWGGVHVAGDAVGRGGPYWPGWDIARGILTTPSGLGYAVLDGWGGVHIYGDAPRPTGTAWAPGADWRAFALTGNGYL